MKEDIKPRTLVDICTDEYKGHPKFQKILLGNLYCSIKMNKPLVECSYRSPFMDENKLYVCNFYKYTLELPEQVY